MQKSLSNKDIEEIYKNALSIQDTDDIARIKSISCDFFRKGNCPKVYSSECRGCLDDEAVLRCRAIYLSKIFDKPQFTWSKNFDAPLKRENKVRSEDLSSSIGVQCATCYMADRCAMYKAGAECGIDWGENVDVKELTDKDVIETLIHLQIKRVKRMSAFEEVDGGMVDLNTSGEMDRLTRLVAERHDLSSFKVKASLEMSGNSENQDEGGGLLAKIFGKPKTEAIEAPQQKAIPEKTQDINYEEFNEDISTPEPIRIKKGIKRRG